MVSRKVLLAVSLASVALLSACKKVDDEPKPSDAAVVAAADNTADNMPIPVDNTSDNEDKVPDAWERLDGGQYGNIYRDKETGCQWTIFYENDNPLPPVERKGRDHQQICGPLPKFKGNTSESDDSDADDQDDDSNKTTKVEKVKS